MLRQKDIDFITAFGRAVLDERVGLVESRCKKTGEYRAVIVIKGNEDSAGNVPVYAVGHCPTEDFNPRELYERPDGIDPCEYDENERPIGFLH